MAGLGDTLRRQYQARQMGDALGSLRDPLAQFAAERHALDPSQQQMADLRLALLKRLMGGEQSGGAQAAPGAPPGAAMAGGATPSFERAPDDRRQMDVRIGGGPPGSPERALRGLSGMIEGPEARALAAMLGPQMPGAPQITGAPSQAMAARGAPSGFGGGPGSGGDLPGGAMPEGLAALLGGLQSPRTRGELARMEPQLQVLEQMLAADQKQRMMQELARMKEQGLLGRAEAKEKAVGERFETKEQRLAREHTETLTQRGEIAGKTDETTRILRTETERHNRAMEDLRRQALGLQRIASERALTKQERDQVFQLDRAYQSRIGNIARLRDTIISSTRDANEPQVKKLELEAESLRLMIDPLLKAVGATEAKRRGVAAPKPAAPMLEDDDALLDAFGIE